MFFIITRHLSVKNLVDVKQFGTHLRKIREERELSQQQLADMSNIAKITIQRIENGKFAVTIDVLFSISKALDMTLEEFFKGM